MPRKTCAPRHHLALPVALRALGAAGAAVALAVALAACSGGNGLPAADTGSSPGSSTTTSAAAVTPDPAAVASASATVSAEHDEADLQFPQQMTVHHRGAVQMARLADSSSVRDLAARIEAAQTPEIARMTGWLQAWGAPTATSGPGDHSSMGSMGMSAETGAALERATGAEFDELFLRQMTLHHRDALVMAEAEQADGVNPQALELAGAIVTSQTAEIQEMDQLLAALRG